MRIWTYCNTTGVYFMMNAKKQSEKFYISFTINPHTTDYRKTGKLIASEPNVSSESLNICYFVAAYRLMYFSNAERWWKNAGKYYFQHDKKPLPPLPCNSTVWGAGTSHPTQYSDKVMVQQWISALTYSRHLSAMAETGCVKVWF